jgi:predicted DNA-binding transcriptional regulator AlpA
MEWRIWAESASVDPGQAPELMEALQDALAAEPGALGPVAGARRPRLSAVFIVDASTLAEAAVLGERIFATALRSATRGEVEPLRIEVEPEDFEEDSSLLGAHEVAALLGVSRQRVYQYIERADFPKPSVALARGQLWERDAVKEWAASAPRQPGRPRTSK